MGLGIRPHPHPHPHLRPHPITRRAREEAFEKTFTILPLDGGTLPKTPNLNPSPNPNPNPTPSPNPSPNPMQARYPT